MIEHRLALFGAPIQWRTLIESWMPEESFVDNQVKGPALLASSKLTDKPGQNELDQTKRKYLHVVEGTLGSDLGAGLFTKRA